MSARSEFIKKNHICVIYTDPLTEKEVEGDARLLKLLIDEDDKQYWRVHFLSDGFETCRWIKK